MNEAAILTFNYRYVNFLNLQLQSQVPPETKAVKKSGNLIMLHFVSVKF